MSKTDPLNSVPDEYHPNPTSLYDLFDVSPDAPTEDIQVAYKQKMKEHHPDQSDHENAEEIAFALNRAIDVIGDQNERLLYDQLGHDEYFNSTSRTTSLTSDVDETTGDASIYEMIRMTTFEAHVDENNRLIRQIISSTGFKLFVMLGLIFAGLVGFLLTI